jgi:hypothetical protein
MLNLPHMPHPLAVITGMNGNCVFYGFIIKRFQKAGHSVQKCQRACYLTGVGRQVKVEVEVEVKDKVKVEVEVEVEVKDKSRIVL